MIGLSFSNKCNNVCISFISSLYAIYIYAHAYLEFNNSTFSSKNLASFESFNPFNVYVLNLTVSLVHIYACNALSPYNLRSFKCSLSLFVILNNI
jgi:hypothetical protein